MKTVNTKDGRILRASEFHHCGWPKNLEICRDGKTWESTPNINHHIAFVRG